VFSLHYHLVLVTKYRRRVLTKQMLKRLNEIFSEQAHFEPNPKSDSLHTTTGRAHLC
jgi:REP element-mobilizing transposase RayT